MSAPYAAVILAGGRGRRLGGQAKPELLLGGRRLLDRVLDATVGAQARIVVGPATALPDGVVLTREDPPGGGPVAGLAAGLLAVDAGLDLVVVLAADLPFVTAEVIGTLLSAVRDSAVGDGAVLVDDDGREQLLLGAWRTTALRAALGAMPVLENAALRAVFAGLDVARIAVPVPAGSPPPWWDCDNAADVSAAKEWT